MTNRVPLVRVSGKIVELPAGDTISGAAPGSPGANGSNGSNGSNGTNGTGFTKISSVVTSSSAATITFSSIANSYVDLMIIITGRDTAASAGLNVRMKINGDTTSANYSAEQFHEEVNASNNGGNNASTTAGSVAARIPGSLNNANAVGSATITIPNYKGVVFYKSVIGVYGTYFSNNAVPLDAGNDFFVWKNTAAITDIVLTAGGTAFVDGTTATLYGLG